MASDLAGATNEESIDVGVKEEKIKTPLKCRNPYSTLPKMGKSGSRIISETIWHLSQIRLQTSSDINQKQTNKQKTQCSGNHVVKLMYILMLQCQ